MIIFKEFIWKKDHYAFHITNIEVMKNICRYGLKPQCGERSISVGDNTKGIFFFDYLNSLSKWIDILYKNKNINELELLRFNLKNRKWIKQNNNEFYLPNKVLPERIEYLRIYDIEKNIYLPLNFVDNLNEKSILMWNRLDNYKPLIKTNGIIHK